MRLSSGRPSPFGHTRAAPVTWRTHRTRIVSSFAGYVAGSTGKWRQRLRGRPGYLTGAFVSPSSLRQGPKSSTGSARIPLAMVTSLNTGLMTVLGSLDRGRYPSNGTANRRSFQLFRLLGDLTEAALRKKQRLRSNLESVQPARCRLCRQPGQAESGHRFFTVGTVGPTVAILPGSPW